MPQLNTSTSGKPRSSEGTTQVVEKPAALEAIKEELLQKKKTPFQIFEEMKKSLPTAPCDRKDGIVHLTSGNLDNVGNSEGGPKDQVFLHAENRSIKREEPSGVQTSLARPSKNIHQMTSNLIAKLKQEGRAKMTAPSKGDPKQNQALLKWVISKESSSPAPVVKPSHEQIPKNVSASMALSKMVNLKSILSSVMKTSISQVLRNKIDSPQAAGGTERDANSKEKEVVESSKSANSTDQACDTVEEGETSCVKVSVPPSPLSLKPLEHQQDKELPHIPKCPELPPPRVNKARKSIPIPSAGLLSDQDFDAQETVISTSAYTTPSNANAPGTKAPRPKKHKKKFFRGGTYDLYIGIQKKKGKKKTPKQVATKESFTSGTPAALESSVSGGAMVQESAESAIIAAKEKPLPSTTMGAPVIASVDVSDNESLGSEDFHTPSEMSFMDEEVSSEHSHISHTSLVQNTILSAGNIIKIQNTAEPGWSTCSPNDVAHEKEATINDTTCIPHLEAKSPILSASDPTPEQSNSLLSGQVENQEEGSQVTLMEQGNDEIIDEDLKIISVSTGIQAGALPEVPDPSPNVGTTVLRAADTKEDAAVLPTEEPAVPEASKPPDTLSDSDTVIDVGPECGEEFANGDMSESSTNDVARPFAHDLQLMEAPVVIPGERKSVSSIASSVKNRQRLKKRFLDDPMELDSASISSSLSNGSETCAPKKAKKTFHSPGSDTPSSASESGNGMMTRMNLVFESSLPPITTCTCAAVPLDKAPSKATDGKLYCQAIDSIEGRLVGCCNGVTTHQLVRPSVKIPFSAVCEVHVWRLQHHQCCPGCGIFCTQGSFLQCRVNTNNRRQIHLFHKRCQSLQENGLPPACLHCGRTSSFKVVRLELSTPTPPTFYLSQRPLFTLPKARMSFSRPTETKEEEKELETSKSFQIPETGKVLYASSLLLGPDRLQLESLLSTLSRQLPASALGSTRNLYQSSKAGETDKVLQILAMGVDPNHKFEDYSHDTALHAAASEGHLVVVHLLVQAGSVLDHMNDRLYTPLMHAIERKQLPVVQYLIKAGAQLDARGEDGMTCFHLAAKCGSLEVCRMLLETGRINVNVQDDGGWTPIVWSTEHKHLGIVQLLLERGSDPNIRDNEENIALHWSAFSGSVEISQIFLDMGCSLSAFNEHGDTPLHVAARQDNYECVVLFLARGADIEARNKENEVPISCCRDAHSPTWMALSMNRELKRLTANRVTRAESILHRDISRGKEANPIQCVNAVDDEKAPTDFLYITENCETSVINVDRTITSLQSCQCEDDCTSPSCTCATISFKCWYDREGRLLPEFNMLDPPMIFECNRACLCWKNCNHRVLQHGISCRLQLFRANAKGWGVRTLKDIPKGTFICEYIGEIISDSEADHRADDSYLFDLDNRDGETFCLDARYYGNISRFINHLCEPNLVPVKIFVDHQDLSFPRIAFFSSRDVAAYEELGFDYGEKFWVIKCKRFTCECGSPKCKYSKHTIQETLENYYRRQKEEQVEDSLNPLQRH